MSIKNAIRDENDYVQLYEKIGKLDLETVRYKKNVKKIIRFNQIMNLLYPLSNKGLTMLDAGCASGLYVLSYCKKGGKSVGVDISQSVIEKAKKNLELNKLDQYCSFFIGNIEDLSFLKNKKFDVILCTETLEHVNSPEKAMVQFNKYLKIDGYILLTVPNKYFELLPFIFPKLIISFFRLKTGKILIQQTKNGRRELSRFSIRDYLIYLLKNQSKKEIDFVTDTSFRNWNLNIERTLYRHGAYTPKEIVDLLPKNQYKIITKKTFLFTIPLLDKILPIKFFLVFDKIFSSIPFLKKLGWKTLILARKINYYKIGCGVCFTYLGGNK